MTAPTHPHAAMSLPPDTPQTPAPEEAATPAAATTPAKPRTANALVAVLTAVVTVMGGALAGLLVHEFNSIDAEFAAIDTGFAAIDTRFASLDADMDARFVNLQANMDDKFAAVDARFDSLEAGQAEIARTLAVLVAELNARAAVDAALAGQLLTPDTADTAEPHSTEP